MTAFVNLDMFAINRCGSAVVPRDLCALDGIIRRRQICNCTFHTFHAIIYHVMYYIPIFKSMLERVKRVSIRNVEMSNVSRCVSLLEISKISNIEYVDDLSQFFSFLIDFFFVQ